MENAMVMFGVTDMAEVKKAVKTVEDYMDDMEGKMQDAFDIEDDAAYMAAYEEAKLKREKADYNLDMLKWLIKNEEMIEEIKTYFPDFRF